MKTTIFVPEKINVGFQGGRDTFTGQLAYIIYFDEKGKLRKEKSWESWRQASIPNQIHENVPVSGFVLNKKAGGYSTGWNHRQTYVRVYDPRGFEFEITIANLLFILENTNSIKGKGLEGEFVYGWDGKDLLLVPTDSPDYVEIAKINALRHMKDYVKAKDLVLGAKYLSKENEECIYMGKFREFDWQGRDKGGAYHYFAVEGLEGKYKYNTMRSITSKFVQVLSEESVLNFADIMDDLETRTMFSPISEGKAKYFEFDKEEFYEKAAADQLSIYHGLQFWTPEGIGLEVRRQHNKERRETHGEYFVREQRHYTTLFNGSIEAIFDMYKPMWKQIYLANGKLHKEVR